MAAVAAAERQSKVIINIFGQCDYKITKEDPEI